jgi:Cys-tRNA(Pro)/Cys-tRNA(Cys) deacylase
MASRGTPAILVLERAGIAFETVTYAYDSDADRIGLQAAEAIGEPAARVLKTLLVEVDGRPACVVLPSDGQASMKKVAAAFGGRSAAMMAPAAAERITGYKVGGISPFGQKRRLPIAVEEASLAEPHVYVNGGRRGLQLRLAPADLVRAAEAKPAALLA